MQQKDISITDIQSILFDKRIFTLSQAKAKIKLWGLEPIKFHETATYYRFRIQNPHMFDYLRTKRASEGILYIIGVKR